MVLSKKTIQVARVDRHRAPVSSFVDKQNVTVRHSQSRPTIRKIHRKHHRSLSQDQVALLRKRQAQRVEPLFK
ncbi:unnamed protein product [Adineta ricciae]|uniref:Uncharacterized protein n=1 Tax=Adineta ricciae TaxID=249248 RepID=A0A815LD16_ADIRI|nr:unnamed protein product [Adineta ricciae]